MGKVFCSLIPLALPKEQAGACAIWNQSELNEQLRRRCSAVQPLRRAGVGFEQR